MSVAFSELTTHSQRMAMFQSNYDCLKQMRTPVSCKSIPKCGVINAFQVSKLLSAYRTKMLTSKQETDGKGGSERMKSALGKPILIEKSSLNDSHSTLFVPSVNSNFENLSDDALSYLFASELEKSNKDKEVIRETLSHLSVGSEITLDAAMINLGNDRQWRKLEDSTGNDTSYSDEPEYDISAGTKQKERATQLADHFYYQKCGSKCNENNATTGADNGGVVSKIVKHDTLERNLSDRPHRCSICKMAFKRKLHLKRHFTVTHTKNKNFSCDTCGKQFSRKDYLDKHLSGHQRRNLKLKLLQQGIVVRTKMHSKTEKKPCG